MRTTINIIIPCYNPVEKDWADLIISEFQRLCQLVPEMTLSLVIVNDGSSKGTIQEGFATLSQQLPATKLISYTQNRGKGYALRQGVAAAEADYYVFTDVDFPYELESTATVIHTLLQRQGIAAGHRNKNYYKKVPLFRKLLSVAFRTFIRFVGIPVDDTQCGLKGFDNAGKAIFVQTTTDRYLFDFEFLVLAARKKTIPIYAVPVQLKDGVQFSTMGLNVLRTEFLNLIKILLYSKTK